MKRLSYLSHDTPASKAKEPELAFIGDLNTRPTQIVYDSLFFYTTCLYAKETLDVYETKGT